MMDNAKNLVRMANQIASFFTSYPEEQGTEETAMHILRSWHPRMRQELFAHAVDHGDELHPLALLAIKKLQAPAAT
jgi:formate dehydrogenase subunit delta